MTRLSFWLHPWWWRMQLSNKLRIHADRCQRLAIWLSPTLGEELDRFGIDRSELWRAVATRAQREPVRKDLN